MIRKHFGGSHFVRVSFVVEQNVTPNPGNIGLFRANGIMLELDDLTNRVEKFLRLSVHQ